MEGRIRVVIEGVSPEIDCGRYPAKRVAGVEIVVGADVLCDGHDLIDVILLYRKVGESLWREARMKPVGNDRWTATFIPDEPGLYTYTVQGLVNHFRTWQSELRKKFESGQDVSVQLQIGMSYLKDALQGSSEHDASLLRATITRLESDADNADKISLCLTDEIADVVSTYTKKTLVAEYPELALSVDREKAGFSTWYELFPRSLGEPGRHGTFRDILKILPELAEMGFDVLYLPPIHPIGVSNRKGRNNSPTSIPGDPGSPWAIGAEGGGHKSVHPELGTMDDFGELVRKADQHGLEVAMDIAFQCSPDHPYVKEHPEWFLWRPDGTVQYAENPPKKYEDIVPFFFETAHWKELWEELKSVLLFWIDKGIRIFRIDNPHTKPFTFWEWLISEVKKDHPDVIFLSEAFTRPKVMYRLAKVGFTQSYTYFTWRNTKQEIMAYVKELTRTEVKEYFRPNFWPNTPDILPQYLQYGGRAAFVIRLVLAATLSSNYGIYGPVYELCISRGISGKEEYLDAEKYQIQQWDWSMAAGMKQVITDLNRIRRSNISLQRTDNVTFYDTDNDSIIFYGKSSPDRTNELLIVVNLDALRPHSGKIRIPLDELGIRGNRPYLVHDLLSEEKFIWQGEWNTVELGTVLPARIFRIVTRLRNESDFDYFS